MAVVTVDWAKWDLHFIPKETYFYAKGTTLGKCSISTVLPTLYFTKGAKASLQQPLEGKQC